jgi:SAM-dependent methyltransferase
MRYSQPAWWLPRPLRRYILHFEGLIEDAVAAFAAAVPKGARLLDAGSGEGQYAHWFAHARYTGVDLAVGDAAWNYSKLDAVADLGSLPFADGSFDAAINIVTLEHVREPARVIAEIARVLKPGGSLLLVVPHEWEVHQSPHDYFRYTRHGVEHLLSRAGLEARTIEPAGGYFRLMSRRLLNGLQFFSEGARRIAFIPAALFLVPSALLFPLLDGFDRDRNFTLGYVCKAIKPPAH